MVETTLPENNKTDITDLISNAKVAQSHSYSPYSKFKVGAAILSNNGHIFVGCNVENAAYPLGQCAEASAISAMILAGEKEIKDIVIMCPTNELCPPCGGCRQKISEFAKADTMVHMATPNGEVKSVTMEQILPFAFQSDSLPD